jgi:WD40 repeat protein
MVALTERNGSVYRVEVASGEIERILSGDQAYPFSLQFTVDGRYLAAGTHGTVFDTQTWEIVTQPEVEGTFHSNLVFSEVGDWYALPAADGNIYIWRWSDLLDGLPVTVDAALAVLEGTGDSSFSSYTTLDASPDGRLLVVDGRDGIQLYETTNFSEVARIRDGGNLVRFSPDGQKLLVGAGYCYVCGADAGYLVGTARVYAVPTLD